MGPHKRAGLPRRELNLKNPPGRKKIQAIQSKITGPNNNQGKRVSGKLGLIKKIQADFVKNVTGLLLSNKHTRVQNVFRLKVKLPIGQQIRYSLAPKERHVQNKILGRLGRCIGQ